MGSGWAAATLGGVDVNAGLMSRANVNAEQLGLVGVRFDTAPIGNYRCAHPGQHAVCVGTLLSREIEVAVCGVYVTAGPRVMA